MLTDNLLAYWKLDNDYTDASGNGHTLTPYNSPSFAAGKINQGIQLVTGSHQYLKPGGTLGLFYYSAFSVSCWFKLSSNPATNNRWILWWDALSGAGYFGAEIYNDGTYTYADWAGGNDWIQKNFNDGQWHLFVCTTNGTNNSQMYIDGVKMTFGYKALQASGGDGAGFQLGSSVGDNHYLDGFMDECGVWTRQLSDAEADALWSAGNGLSYPFVATGPKGNMLALMM
jgi:hypothetical protein